MTVKRKIGVASFVSFTLGIAVSYLFVYFITVKDFVGLAPKKLGEVPLEGAKKNIKAYQDRLAYAKLALHPDAKVKGIVHDTTGIQSYFASDFRDFVESHQNVKPGYHWEVGLYPNVAFDSSIGRNRLNIYFIPTMVKGNRIKKDIREYFSAISGVDSVYYEPTSAKWAAAKSYVFDQGTLFP